ncbi:UBX domain-containing protein 10, partial [Acanthisitta chloris]
MATAVLLSSTPAPLCCPSSTAATMHVTRPKSAKGRRRPTLSHSQGMESCPSPPGNSSPSPRELPNSQRALLSKAAFPSSQEIPELLQQVPLRSSSSLNKYRVLPSIGCKGTGSDLEALAEQTTQLEVREGQEDPPKCIKTLSGEQGSNVSSEESSHMQHVGRKMRQESTSMSPVSVEEPHLLLAVRAPSGQRFEHHFKPSDSLQTVLAVAGDKLLANYQGCSVETMEVPRRSFSDLTKSLHECGILHKSVLCIQQDQQHDAE